MRCDGDKVVRAREAQGLSREDVARRAGVSNSVVERMERGVSVNDESVQAVAAALGIVFDALRHSDEGREAAVPSR